MTSSGLILYFEPDSKTSKSALEQLDEIYDLHSTAGSYDKSPHAILVSQETWTTLEGDLQKRYDIKSKRDIHVPLDKTPHEDIKVMRAYNALVYRARPIVAIDGENLVADWVGANG